MKFFLLQKYPEWQVFVGNSKGLPPTRVDPGHQFVTITRTNSVDLLNIDDGKTQKWVSGITKTTENPVWLFDDTMTNDMSILEFQKKWENDLLYYKKLVVAEPSETSSYASLFAPYQKIDLPVVLTDLKFGYSQEQIDQLFKAMLKQITVFTKSSYSVQELERSADERNTQKILENPDSLDPVRFGENILKTWSLPIVSWIWKEVLHRTSRENIQTIGNLITDSSKINDKAFMMFFGKQFAHNRLMDLVVLLKRHNEHVLLKKFADRMLKLINLNFMMNVGGSSFMSFMLRCDYAEFREVENMVKKQCYAGALSTPNATNIFQQMSLERPMLFIKQYLDGQFVEKFIKSEKSRDIVCSINSSGIRNLTYTEDVTFDDKRIGVFMPNRHYDMNDLEKDPSGLFIVQRLALDAHIPRDIRRNFCQNLVYPDLALERETSQRFFLYMHLVKRWPDAIDWEKLLKGRIVAYANNPNLSKFVAKIPEKHANLYLETVPHVKELLRNNVSAFLVEIMIFDYNIKAVREKVIQDITYFATIDQPKTTFVVQKLIFNATQKELERITNSFEKAVQENKLLWDSEHFLENMSCALGDFFRT